MNYPDMKNLNEEILVERLTRGTTDYHRRHDPKVIRVRHFEPAFSLVQKCGGSYSNRMGPVYVPGSIDFVRHPVDVKMIGGFKIWSTARDEHGTFTDKRMKRWLEIFREDFIDDVDFESEHHSNTTQLLLPIAKIILEESGKKICNKEDCNFIVSGNDPEYCASHCRE